VSIEPYTISPDQEDKLGKRDRKAMGMLNSRGSLIVDPAVRVSKITRL
jgi:hypothetical protein